MTVLEVIQRGSEFLARKGVDSPRLQVELLLAHLLQLPRLKLYLDFERTLTESEAKTLRELVRRRGEREPLQHLLGTACFCGLEIGVNREVLIPRPETEQLAERAWRYLEQRRTELARPLMVLDFGTGSGCLAIVMAVRCPEARVHAVESSPAALETARQNALNLQVAERISFHSGDGFKALPDGLRFDLLVSNPPYIPTGEIEGLQREVWDYEPRLALDGGADGLSFYRRLAVEAPGVLNSESRIMLEIGAGQGKGVTAILREREWEVEPVERDYAGHERIIIARRKV